MRNEKGISLLEVLMAAMIAGMIGWGIQTLIVNSIRWSITIQKRVDSSIAKGIAGKYTVIYFDDGKCHQMDSTYWGKEYNTNTVMVYTDAGCTQALGTVGALTNDTFFNDVGNTTWIVSVYPGRLRALVTNLNK